MIEFGSLADLALHLTKATVGGLVATKSGLARAAEVLEKEAKSEFGHYQDAIGPFPEWPELADSTKDDRTAKGFTENDPLLRTGDLRDSIHHEVDEWEAVVGSTSPIMPFHEFGTSKMPPRPVLGTALYRRMDQIVGLIGRTAVAGLVGLDPSGNGHYAAREVDEMTDVHSSLGYDVLKGTSRV